MKEYFYKPPPVIARARKREDEKERKNLAEVFL